MLVLSYISSQDKIDKKDNVYEEERKANFGK